MTFATVAIAALTLAAPAAARRSRPTTSVQPPPPTTTIDSGNVNEHDTSSSTSTATCNAEVKASTWSEAVSGFTDLVSAVTLDFCFSSGSYWKHEADPQQLDLQISAIANLLLESKLECETSGKYAVACATAWASAHSFAAAGFEAYASAWADGSNLASECNCAVDVFAQADVLTSAFAEIWTKIYKELDDSVCASTYDGTADSIKTTQNIHCVGNLVLDYWVKATAKVVIDGKCEPSEFLECKECCKDAHGVYDTTCNYDDCYTECEKTERAKITATAEAAISAQESAHVKCEAGLTSNQPIDYDTYWANYKPVYFNWTVDYTGNTEVKCEAEAHATAFAESASAQAVVIKGIWENTCTPYTWIANGDADFDNSTQAWAKAYIDILAEAHTTCALTGGDAEYDGGCARAVSYSRAYAKACAEAFSSSMVDFTFGKKDSCNCDISVSTLTEAIAHEIEIMSVFYEAEVEARSCTVDSHGTPDVAHIKQTCVASAFADMFARAMASVSLEGNCAPSSVDKEAYCADQCDHYTTYDPDWAPCITACTKESEAAVKAAVEAVATITITTSERCTADPGPESVGETYLTVFNGYARSTQE